MSVTMHSATLSTDRLRAHFRSARRALTDAQQADAAGALAQHVVGSPAFHHAQSLAFYVAADGELSPECVLRAALAAGKRCFLPVANPDELSLRFLSYSGAADALVPNRWGLLEPREDSDTAEIEACNLDLVFLPLVACDAAGTRLGMGKGFYDRAFAFTLDSAAQASTGPLLVGVAHDCQLSEAPLPRENWDVPLTAIATPSRLISPR